MGARFLLLRHGQIAANKRGRWHGSTDSKLTWLGRRQAKRTGSYLAMNEQISAVYSSPLQRCQATADFVTKHLDISINTLPGLAEMSIGEWEDMPFRQLAAEHDFVNRASKDPDFAPPQGESLTVVSERVTAAFREVDEQHGADETVLIVSHGVAMAVALADFLEDSPARWTNYHFDNCSLTEFFLSPEPYVEAFNRSAHL
jgi:probable phosphoglycerate mutase